jgi:uncharacterized protein
MGVSRQTFGRVIESARKKVAEALVRGKALKIEGGAVQTVSTRKITCADCRCTWELSYGTGRPETCPACGSGKISRAEGQGAQENGRCRAPARRGCEGKNTVVREKGKME